MKNLITLLCLVIASGLSAQEITAELFSELWHIEDFTIEKLSREIGGDHPAEQSGSFRIVMLDTVKYGLPVDTIWYKSSHTIHRKMFSVHGTYAGEDFLDSTGVIIGDKRPEGDAQLRYFEGVVEDIHFIFPKPCGFIHRDFFLGTGRQHEVTSYKGCKIDGDQLTYYKSGVLEKHCHFDEGRAVGTWIWYDEKGEISKEETY